ncbi:MAG: ATP-binding protein [Anaerolineae bacterium]
MVRVNCNGPEYTPEGVENVDLCCHNCCQVQVVSQACSLVRARFSMEVNAPASFTSFGELLKHLRLRIQITQRDLAARVGYNHAHLSRLENNQRVPDAAAIKALFIPALELEDQPEWAARLLELASLASPGKERGNGELAPSSLNPSRVANSRLPQPLTELLGRDDVVRQACEILQRPAVRLLTLVGPPGLGKTRLAVEVASELSAGFSEGAIFIDLSPVREPDLVLSEVARVLDVKDSANDLSENLVAALRLRDMLLVLDNFEHVLESAPQVARWLQASARLKILTTSREPLRLSGEYELSVPALSPEARLELFVQRACAVQPAFAITDENRSVVAEICERLDGLPLAIELAAARVKQFPVQVMADRLGQRLQWLTAGAREGPSWRQTLRGAIDWSYNLLSPSEREHWLRMSVFAGGCTPEAAQVVTGAALEDLLALSDKNLVAVTTSDPENELRFTLLETLHEYARERLSEDPDAEQAALLAHASYYAELADAAPLDSTGPRLAAALDQLEREYDNLRAAMGWAMQHQPELAVHLVVCLAPFWYLRSHFREGRIWQSAALACAGSLQRLRLTRQLGETCWNLGEQAAARQYLEESVALARTASDADALAEGLNQLGRVLKDMGSFEAALVHFDEGLSLARRSGNRPAQIALLRNLGNIKLDRGEMQSALEYFEESLALARHGDTPLGIAGALNNAGIAYLALHDYTRAKAHFLEALPIFQEYRNQFGTALVIVNIGRVEHARGALDEAQKNFETSLRLARETGRKWSIAYALSNLGLVACDQRDWDASASYFREALEVALEISAPPRALDALSGWAILLSRTGRPEEAAELLGLVKSHRTAEHEARERLESLPVDLSAQLPQNIMEAAFQRGAAAAWEDLARRCLAGFPKNGPE